MRPPKLHPLKSSHPYNPGSYPLTFSSFGEPTVTDQQPTSSNQETELRQTGISNSKTRSSPMHTEERGGASRYQQPMQHQAEKHQRQGVTLVMNHGVNLCHHIRQTGKVSRKT
ncbi:Hypothetical predicted protein, partial [Pelobates cultripes]